MFFVNTSFLTTDHSTITLTLQSNSNLSQKKKEHTRIIEVHRKHRLLLSPSFGMFLFTIFFRMNVHRYLFLFYSLFSEYLFPPLFTGICYNIFPSISHDGYLLSSEVDACPTNVYVRESFPRYFGGAVRPFHPIVSTELRRLITA